MARKRLLSNESGFTIIEVLIALAIFSIGILAVGALQARSLMDTGDVARKTEAWTILDEQVGILKALPFYADNPPTIHPAALVAGNFAAPAHTVNMPAVNPRYTVHWFVEDHIPIPQANAAVLVGVPAGNYTVSKLITARVTRLGDNPLTDALGQVQFTKTWWATGVP